MHDQAGFGQRGRSNKGRHGLFHRIGGVSCLTGEGSELFCSSWICYVRRKSSNGKSPGT
jgi:hypothetical protein